MKIRVSGIRALNLKSNLSLVFLLAFFAVSVVLLLGVPIDIESVFARI